MYIVQLVDLQHVFLHVAGPLLSEGIVKVPNESLDPFTADRSSKLATFRLGLEDE